MKPLYCGAKIRILSSKYTLEPSTSLHTTLSVLRSRWELTLYWLLVHLSLVQLSFLLSLPQLDMIAQVRDMERSAEAEDSTVGVTAMTALASLTLVAARHVNASYKKFIKKWNIVAITAWLKTMTTWRTKIDSHYLRCRSFYNHTSYYQNLIVEMIF